MAPALRQRRSGSCLLGHLARGLGLAAASAALAWPAAASNPGLTPLGGEAAMSGAVAAMGRDTGMAFYNPAGLGANRRGQFNMSSTMAVLRYRVIPDAFRVELPGGKSASAELSSLLFIVMSTS